MNNKINLVILLLMFGWFSKLFAQATTPQKSPWEHDLEMRNPSKPINFGYKCAWVAVKTENMDSLLMVLGLANVKKVTWVDGMLKSMYGVFVLPPIDGWILMVGGDLPAPQENGLERSRELLDKLSASFGEAQLFGNHSVSGSAFWMKSINGKTARLYSIGDGNSIIEGAPTEIERQWNLLDTNTDEAITEEYWDKAVYPEAEHVLEVAQNWSINPMTLEGREHVGEFGYLGTLKVK